MTELLAPLPATARRRVLIVDDHPIIRHGVAQTIGLEPDLEVSGQASSAAEALAILREGPTDLAVVDISLGGTNGIELTKLIRGEYPALPVLVLSMHDEDLYAMRALRAGAGGYIMKREAPHLLLTAVRTVLGGGTYASPHVTARMEQPEAEDEAPGTPIESLTDRELEVLQLVGEGHSTREIASRLSLSAKTIETHRLNMKDKLALNTAPELIRYAVNWVRAQTG